MTKFSSQTMLKAAVAPAVLGLALLSAPAHAQDADDHEAQAIIVTGSRIARPTLDSPIPVTTLSAQDIMRGGQTNVGDVLNELPSMRSTMSQSNSTQYIGTAGLNFLDLRGLGETRTLVLVNGRRHVTSSEGDFLVDVNTIPTDLIERVDIVTGGNSAVYGSDAMAGVVNFVLKRDFDGLTLSAQSGISSRGDRGTQRIAGTFGHNFADGRGNISLALDYTNANTLLNTYRPGLTGAFSGRRQFQLVDDPYLDNSIPDRKFLTGIHSAGLSNGGSFIAYSGGSILDCGVAAGCLPNGLPRIFQFQSDGSLRENNYGIDFRPVGSGNNQHGDGATFTDTGTLQPGYKRYVANLMGHYDVSEGFRPFFEAKFVRVDAFAQNEPTFSQGGPQGLDEDGVLNDPVNYLIYTPISLDNAYLSPAARATIQSLLPAGATYFNLNRNNVDLGTRDEKDRRDTFRIVVGAEGTFNGDWHYDVSFNYGHLKTKSFFYNNRIEENFYNAIDAVYNSNNEIVCRINQAAVFDPSCHPLNILGNGKASREALNYINTTSTRQGKATEINISANLVGNSAQWFELPGGPVGFAIGAEYRRETAFYAYDDRVKNGETFLNAISDFNPPSFMVKEAYGEINIPLLKGMNFVNELSLSGAVRVADYKGSAGTVWAYNAGGIYSPIPDIKFRVNYSRSVRAPTLSDLYQSASQNYAIVDDPCDVNYITKGKPTRPANCAAAGVPDGFENSFTRTGSLEILSGGNPDLEVEKSRSLTYGLMLQPRFLPGLSITADYYDIKIEKVISAVSAQEILNGCYDGPSLDNGFCKFVFPRNADHTFQLPALLQTSLNFSAMRAKGIDVDVNYNHRFDADNRLQLRFVGNWVRMRNDFPYLDAPDEPDRVKGELGDPIHVFNFSADYTYKALTLGYELRYIGRQSITDWESQHDTYGVPALDPYYADVVYYPSVVYHNIRASIDVDKRFTFYGGVDNLTDKKPPYGILGTGSVGDADAIFDNIGRFMYAGVRAKF